jgi:hypothetical protein
LKEIGRLNGRRAFSPVIAAIILSAVVLAIGGGVWAYSQGAMTITAEEYSRSVAENTNVISERFIIEHVAYVGSQLKVWIFNYGDVDIEVKVQVGDITHPQEWIKMKAGSFVAVEPLSYSAGSGEELVIRAYTKRGNDAYYRYLVP